MAKIVVFTGGPCGGKSTILKIAKAYLEQHNVPVIVLPEMAALLRDAGISLAQKQPIHLQRTIAQTHLSLLKSAKLLAKENSLILCDRGLLDGKVFCSDEEFFASTGLTKFECLHLYDAVFHLESVAVSGSQYEQTGRLESMLEAATLDQKLQIEWKQHPRRWVFQQGPSWESKSKRVCEGLLGVAKNLEIERKWFLKDPSFLQSEEALYYMDLAYNCEESLQKALPYDEIKQYYLPSGGRIRIINDSNANYCIKKEIKPGIREELEETISLAVAAALLSSEKFYRKVSKHRYHITDQMPVIFDSISRPLNRPALHLVEAEYFSEEETHVLPQIIKNNPEMFEEVTHNPAFSNKNLAETIGLE